MTWINDYRKWLSESESLKNAQLIVNHLFTDGKDWAKESICALLGNIRIESSVNPNMYEYGYDWGANRGFGLVQWTPRSKYWDWALENGYKESELRNGNAQLDRIDYEVKENIQWIPKQSVFNGLTFKEFRTNSKKLTVAELTESFMWGYERPNREAGLKSLPERIAFAKKCEKELKWDSGGGGGDEPDPKPDPKPDPEPDPEPSFDFSNVLDFFEDFTENVVNNVDKMLTINLYNYDINKNFGNNYITGFKMLDNMYRLKPTLSFKQTLEKIIKEGVKSLENILDNLQPEPDPKPDPKPDPEPDPKPDPKPDPEPEPSGKMYFPLDYDAQGINFWVPPNYPEMDYGGPREGRRHWAYDIGTLGNANVSCHAVRDGEVLSVNADNLGTVVIKHSSDKYYSQYMHLQLGKFTVKKGDKVVAGQKIGMVGGTGGYKIHLHIAISKNGTFGTEKDTINPRTYLKVTGNNKTELPKP